MTDARERRRQRAEANKESFDLAGALRKFMVPIIIVLLSGGIIAYNVAAAQGVFGEDEGCPPHWHAGYSVWDGDQQVAFSKAGPPGDASSPPAVGFHIHGNDGTLHFHPAVERCTPLEDAFEKLGVAVADDRLTVRGEERIANETTQVVVYHQPWGEDWREVTNLGSFMGDQIGNGDRVMIAYMDTNSTMTIEDRQAATKDLSGGNYDPGSGGGLGDEVFITITMTVIFALLAIMVWYNFAKKTW